jgi:hypothetical protein
VWIAIVRPADAAETALWMFEYPPDPTTSGPEGGVVRVGVGLVTTRVGVRVAVRVFVGTAGDVFVGIAVGGLVETDVRVFVGAAVAVPVDPTVSPGGSVPVGEDVGVAVPVGPASVV